mmetsp:Transcript_1551/g.2136  ORF Transcript_1551/g.2136 Transcript_1551/m.2136 type:complete len:125 (-) Transcript_1551:1538-1912(-)
MHLQHPKEQILVATSMNFTADLVAEALFHLEVLKKGVCRVYSASREDIFNVNIQELPEWSIIYKMLFEDERMGSYTRAHTSFVHSLIDTLPRHIVEMSAKFEVEAYFVNTSYRKDDYLKKLEGP